MKQRQSHATGEFREVADLTETERHRLLASERRRILISILSAHSPPVDLETLAEKIAQRDVIVDTVDDDTVNRIMVVLRHKHLPMLVDMEIVAFDQEANQIEFAENWSY